MIAILYPLKMDKDLTKAYSVIYEELHPNVAKNDAINKANAAKNAQAKQVPPEVKAASKRQYTAGGPSDTGANKYTTADKKTIINHNKSNMNNSYEPEGEMIDEKKAPRMQKGAMAYDGPNKERSEAADRVLEKTKNKVRKEGKFRSEWEEMKLNEKNDYRTKFDEWIEGIVKEGYDIERWSDEELIDTFIDEKNLWQSREGVESALLESEKKGLYANIHAKRKRGESPAKPGDEDYPAKNAFKKAAKTAKKEEVEVDESMKQARKNVGASTCWDGYKAKGTKMKGGKKVPNCVKEFSEWRSITEKK